MTCAFGMPWAWHFRPPVGTGKGCVFCLAEGEHDRDEFRAAVARGEYDADGFTPAERRAQQRKASR